VNVSNIYSPNCKKTGSLTTCTITTYTTVNKPSMLSGLLPNSPETHQTIEFFAVIGEADTSLELWSTRIITYLWYIDYHMLSFGGMGLNFVKNPPKNTQLRHQFATLNYLFCQPHISSGRFSQAFGVTCQSPPFSKIIKRKLPGLAREARVVMGWDQWGHENLGSTSVHPICLWIMYSLRIMFPIEVHVASGGFFLWLIGH
jgi:hypothetical protein